MSDTDSHSLGEVWGKVENLESNLTNLSKQVGDGLRNIVASIDANHDKTDRRISDLTRETNARIENVTSSFQQSTVQRGQSTMTAIGILLASMIGLGSLAAGIAGTAFTAYNLIKAPIDQNFADGKFAQARTDAALEELKKVVEARGANNVKDFVPRLEADATKLRAEKNETAIGDLRIDLATTKEAAKAVANEVENLRDEFKNARATEGVTRSEFNDLKDRLAEQVQELSARMDRMTANRVSIDGPPAPNKPGSVYIDKNYPPPQRSAAAEWKDN